MEGRWGFGGETRPFFPTVCHSPSLDSSIGVAPFVSSSFDFFSFSFSFSFSLPFSFSFSLSFSLSLSLSFAGGPEAAGGGQSFLAGAPCFWVALGMAAGFGAGTGAGEGASACEGVAAGEASALGGSAGVGSSEESLRQGVGAAGLTSRRSCPDDSQVSEGGADPDLFT